jgi:hypothetical protein
MPPCDNEVIFHAARDIPDPDRRRQYVREACGGDLARIALVEALLAAADAPDSLQDRPPARPPADATRTESSMPEEDLPLEFLTPSEKPGSLGRLRHYEVQEVIGRGGMGVVLRAFDEELHRVAAIKVMAQQLATNATARKRFKREAQAVAAVIHDHIITIHAVAEANGLPYLVMHYVAGLSLQQRLDRDGPLELQEILRIGMQTALGLAAAHDQGLVHRDIKPANILLENGVERVKITDFGLARAAADADLTQSGTVAGTPQYMSPEQAEGKTIDQRTDLFSLGSVLYAMCTGRAPFRASGAIAVLKRVCEDAPTPIRESNPQIPDWLVEIVDKLHAKDPSQRYQSAAEVAELLGRHLAQVQHPSVVGQVAHVLPEPKAGSRPPTRRRLAIAAAVLVCLFAGLSLTEVAGVTNLRATLIRLFTPDRPHGVETDDPAVKMTVEGAGAFVLLGGKGVEVAKFDTLAKAVQAASAGDTIEVRGNGPFVSEPVDVRQSLVIRAGAGYVPSIALSPALAKRNFPLLNTSAPLVLEGLELRFVGGTPEIVEGRWAPMLLVADHRGSLHIANCRLIFKAEAPFVGYPFHAVVKSLSVRNSVLTGNVDCTSWMYGSGGRCVIENCVSVAGGIGFSNAERDLKDISIRVCGNTMVGNCLALVTFGKLKLPEGAETTPPVHLEISGNVARWDVGTRSQGFLWLRQLEFKEPASGTEAEAFLRRLVGLDEKQNLYQSGTPMLRLLEGKRGQDLADWDRFWAQTKTGSVEGDIRFKGGDLMSRARSAPELITAEDFRLRADSAGYRAGKDGKDLGADIDLVGPGAAYEQWKKTPEYQQWLKESGQVKK